MKSLGARNYDPCLSSAFVDFFRDQKLIFIGLESMMLCIGTSGCVLRGNTSLFSSVLAPHFHNNHSLSWQWTKRKWHCSGSRKPEQERSFPKFSLASWTAAMIGCSGTVASMCFIPCSVKTFLKGSVSARNTQVKRIHANLIPKKNSTSKIIVYMHTHIIFYSCWMNVQICCMGGTCLGGCIPEFTDFWKILVMKI